MLSSPGAAADLDMVGVNPVASDAIDTDADSLSEEKQ